MAKRKAQAKRLIDDEEYRKKVIEENPEAAKKTRELIEDPEARKRFAEENPDAAREIKKAMEDHPDYVKKAEKIIEEEYPDVDRKAKE